MTAINAKTFGKSVWNTIPFFGAPQAWRVREKSTDFWVEAPRFGKNFYNPSFEFSFEAMFVSTRNVQKCFFFSELIGNSSFQWQIATISKGQLISEWPLGRKTFPKKSTKNFYISALKFFCSFLGASWTQFGLPGDIASNIIQKEA